jgi:hypothetical protein
LNQSDGVLHTIHSIGDIFRFVLSNDAAAVFDKLG